jgi:glycerol-3-phosphate dehydrogenase (NAD(P)+)
MIEPSLLILGAGSWGTALGIHAARLSAARLNARVKLWGIDAAHIERLSRQRENSDFLPGIAFPENLEPVVDLAEVVPQATLLMVAVPSSGFRETLIRIRPFVHPEQVLVWATKGLEMTTGAWLHEVLAEELPGFSPAVLSGPSFAREVAQGQPTALTLAATEAHVAERVIEAFHGGSMRLYRNRDVVGVELGGAFKNVLAIAAGIADGAGFGANARAALMTRGLAELQRLGRAVGAQPATLMGLSGLGDLVLTCTDDQSRNRRFGVLLGQGATVAEALARIGQAVEGYATARMAVARARAAGVEMPICEEVHAVLYENRPVQEAVQRLLERDPTAEDDASD